MTKTCAANNIEQQLQQLTLEARRYPDISLGRQQKLDKIVRLVIQSNKLWIENTPYFEDALQQTWLYFCRNINSYDQNKCSVITWLNNCLKWRLRDFYIAETKQRGRVTYLSEAVIEEISSSVDYVASSRGISPILEEIYQWVQADPHQDLQNVHIRGYPDATCQMIILRRLPPETPWKDIAQEFKLPHSTAPNFYQRECLPRLRKFAYQQGYLELIPISQK